MTMRIQRFLRYRAPLIGLIVIAPILSRAPLAFAAGSARGDAKDAETKVEISIYDLVGKHPKTKMKKAVVVDHDLTEAYVCTVIDRLREHESELQTCLGHELQSMKVGLTLSISRSGQATAETANAQSDCVSQAVEALKFAQQDFGDIVVLQIPLLIENRVL